MDLRDKILRALYGGLVATSASGMAACVDGADRENNVTSPWVVSDPGVDMGSATGDMQGSSPDASPSMDMEDGVEDMGAPLSECEQGAKDLTVLPYENWRDDINELPRQPYVVCGDRDVADCNFSKSAPGEVDRFVKDALGVETGCARNPYYRRSEDHIVCGPVPRRDDACCFVISLGFSVGDSCGPQNVGRPFIVDGVARFAAVTREALDWCEPLDLEIDLHLPENLRQIIAASWAEDGAHEHASIASFSRFMMDLMSLGAPRELIELTTDAIADETRHALTCFSIGAAYAGHPIGPAEVDVADSMAHAGDEVEILEAAIEEGCIGESLAAVQAEWCASFAADPAIRDALSTIAEDEGNHALLAWRFVDWMLEQRPHLVPVAEAAFERARMPRETPWALGINELEREGLRHGYLSEALESTIRIRAYNHVVVPCIKALLDKHGVENAPLFVS